MVTAHSQVSLPAFLKLAANDIRWQLLSVLARSDYRIQELVYMIGQPANLVSYHLRQLRDLIAARLNAFVDGHELISVPKDRNDARMQHQSGEAEA